MTFLLTSGCKHAHSPPQAGRGPRKRPQAPPHMVEDKAKQDTQNEGESNKAKREDYPLDRQGQGGDARGRVGGGVGGRGCSSPASYIYIYMSPIPLGST